MGILSIKFSLSWAAIGNEWAAELHSLGCCPSVRAEPHDVQWAQ